jgi:hypothetical protein
MSSDDKQGSSARSRYRDFTAAPASSTPVSRGTAVPVGRSGQQFVKRTARKGLRDLPPLDLRTPSGRELPY